MNNFAIAAANIQMVMDVRCSQHQPFKIYNGCDRIVNDNTYVQGNWSDAVNWVGNEWFPVMEQAGLKYSHISFRQAHSVNYQPKKALISWQGSSRHNILRMLNWTPAFQRSPIIERATFKYVMDLTHC
jgi:hypothetical protein